MEPTDKQKKYDRQLRLWGDHGQAALESAKLCLLNASATGCEILKNLVLPGVGSFTIVDSNKVEPSDLGKNFFVTKDKIGTSRAQTCTELLQELNPLVSGFFLEEDPKEIIRSKPHYFKDFSMVIATQLNEEDVRQLAKILREGNIPLLVARSYGLVGYLRLLLPEHTVVETKPDNTVTDMRIFDPFPALIEWMESIDVTVTDTKEHGHIPYVAILLRALQEWRTTNPGVAPTIPGLRKIVTSMRLSADEENFVEASGKLNTAFRPVAIPETARAVLNDHCAAELTPSSPSFWIIANGVKKFMDNEGQGKLPLVGTVPDMTATTEVYIALQQIFQDKANADAAAVHSYVQRSLSELKRPADSISLEEVKVWCKNAACVRALRYRSIEEEVSSETAKGEFLGELLKNAIENPPNPSEPAGINGTLYLALRAADRFFQNNKTRYPGEMASPDSDLAEFRAATSSVLSEIGISGVTIPDELLLEFARYGAAELHNIAAILGGIGSQEAIKVIVRQWVPMNNTFIFDGMNGTSSVFEL